MKRYKYNNFVLSLILIFQGFVYGQATLFIEGRYGTLSPEIKNFSTVYSTASYIPTVAIGLGADQGFMVVRYSLYEHEGQSILDGAELDTYSHWRQEYLTIGVRTYEQGRLYFELAYAIGRAEEQGATIPEYPALTYTWSADDIRGGAAALGVNIPLVLGLNFSVEAGYLYLPVKNENDKKVNIGGRQLSLGLNWAL